MPKDNNTYVRVKDFAKKSFLCPLNQTQIPPSESTEIADQCVEEDVVSRYAGNICVKPS